MFTESVVVSLLSVSTTLWIYVVHDPPLQLLPPSVQLTHGWPLSGERAAIRAEHHGDFPVGEADCAHPEQCWINQQLIAASQIYIKKGSALILWPWQTRLTVGHWPMFCCYYVGPNLQRSQSLREILLIGSSATHKKRKRKSKFLWRVEVARLLWKQKHCFIKASVCTSGVLSLQVYHFEGQETATKSCFPKLFPLAGAERTN